MRSAPLQSSVLRLLIFVSLLLSTRPILGQVCRLHERQKITASDAGPGDLFSSNGSICMDGDRAIVGAYSDDHAGMMAGSAYVFRRDDSKTPLDPNDDLWIEEAKLTASDAEGWQWFGGSVAISENWAVVGAPWDNEGAAYLFRRDLNGTPSEPSDDVWVEEVKLRPWDPGGEDWFGYAVSLSGNSLVVGAPYQNGYAGAAYVFRRDLNGTPSDPSDDAWTEEVKLLPSDPAGEQWFGYSVSMSEDRIVAGAWGDDDGCPSGVDCNSGSAYVFRLDDHGTPDDESDDFWTQEQKLVAWDTAEYSLFGSAVSMYGDWAVVGALQSNSIGRAAGAVYVFRRDDGGTPVDPGDDFWLDEQKLTASDGAEFDFFGDPVAISGNVLVVGAQLHDDPAGEACGAAYIYDFDGDNWVERQKLSASDPAQRDFLGAAVSVSGHWVLVGAHGGDDACSDDPRCESGAAYAFYLEPTGTALVEYRDFRSCLSGPGGGLPPGYEIHNFDSDEDVDLGDFAAACVFRNGP